MATVTELLHRIVEKLPINKSEKDELHEAVDEDSPAETETPPEVKTDE